MLLIYWASLDLHAAQGLSLVTVSGGYSLVVVCRLLIAAVSLAVELRLSGMQTQ